MFSSVRKLCAYTSLKSQNDCLHILNRRSHYKKNLVVLSCYSHQIKRPIKSVVLIRTTMRSNIFVGILYLRVYYTYACFMDNQHIEYWHSDLIFFSKTHFLELPILCWKTTHIPTITGLFGKWEVLRWPFAESEVRLSKCFWICWETFLLLGKQI